MEHFSEVPNSSANLLEIFYLSITRHKFIKSSNHQINKSTPAILKILFHKKPGTSYVATVAPEVRLSNQLMEKFRRIYELKPVIPVQLLQPIRLPQPLRAAI